MSRLPFLVAAALLLSLQLAAQTKLTLHLDQPSLPMSPRLYGLMTEEINFSYEGGLYGELIRNRTFKDSTRQAAFWSLQQDPQSKATITLERKDGLSEALPISLRLDIENAGSGISIENEGYWGIPIRPSATYKGSFYARSTAGTPLTVSIQSTDGKTAYATAQTQAIGSAWKQYSFTLTTTAGIQPTADTRFVITAKKEGAWWFSLVSLFPPTYNDQPNGFRPDLMQMMADMKPKFLRFPGGNYVEGQTFSNRWDWKRTIGPIESRPGHLSPWHYRSTDGMGLLEFLQWCEQLHMEPLLAVFAGYTLNRDYLEGGPYLQPFVDDALDEIEYITGDASTKWGAERAKDGHPQPFPLHDVEIGNEDGFDVSGSYGGRYVQFYDAIKAKYPQLQIISTVGGKDPLGGRFPAPAGKTEIVDEHYYRTASQMEENAHQYDSYDRSGPKVFVGEWATREGEPTTNFNAALGDAAWMTGMENNADHIIMASYAPLFVNVNPGGMQWKSDLIGYNTLHAFGSPSYYAQKLFSTYLGNAIVKLTAANIPTQLTKLTARDSAQGIQPKSIDALFFSASRDTANNTIYLKLVNTLSTAQPITIELASTEKLKKEAEVWTLKADSPTETNSITDPARIVPVESKLKGIGKTYTLPPLSITILQLHLTK